MLSEMRPAIVLLVLMCIIVGLMSTPVLGWMVP